MRGFACEFELNLKVFVSLPYYVSRLLDRSPGSHKRRDKRCHIASPLLRSALHTCLSAHDIAIDETGSSLAHLPGPPLELMSGTDTEREAGVSPRSRECLVATVVRSGCSISIILADIAMRVSCL